MGKFLVLGIWVLGSEHRKEERERELREEEQVGLESHALHNFFLK